MTRFIARRLVQAVPLLLVISLLVFLLIHAAPGGPLAVYLSNPNVRPQDIERLRHALGLDRPLWQQYFAWLGAFARGDWGYSYSDGRPAAERILERLPATLELVGASLVVALALTFPAGIVAALTRGRWFDRGATAAAFAGISLPVFWFGLLLQMIFAVGLGWLPSSGRAALGAGDVVDRVQHLVLPVAALAFVQAAGWSRYVRGSKPRSELKRSRIVALCETTIAAWSLCATTISRRHGSARAVTESPVSPPSGANVKGSDSHRWYS